MWERAAIREELVVAHGAAGCTAYGRAIRRLRDESVDVMAPDPRRADNTRWFDLHDAPAASPWKGSRGESAESVVARIFAPLAADIPRFVTELRGATRAVLGRVVDSEVDDWRRYVRSRSGG